LWQQHCLGNTAGQQLYNCCKRLPFGTGIAATLPKALFFETPLSETAIDATNPCLLLAPPPLQKLGCSQIQWRGVRGQQ
jgi:hypothetical protein